MSRSGLFVAPVPGTPPVGTAPVDARLALTGLLGPSPQTISGGAITQSATLMQFTVAAAVWQLPDVTNSSATFLSATDLTALNGTAGPGSGSRIDLIVAKQNNYENGDADSKANLSLVTGVASGSPVAPPVPSGAWKVATITVPTSAANAAACTVTLAAPTVLAPPIRLASTLALLNSVTVIGIVVGARASVVSDGENNGDYVWNGTSWARHWVNAVPFAMAAGTGSNAAGAFGTITFPAGRFSVAPIITFTMLTTPPGIPFISSSSAASAQVAGLNPAGTAIASSFQWTAIQMTATTAAG